MQNKIKRAAGLAVIALCAGAALSAPASAKDYYKGYNWQKFVNGDAASTRSASSGQGCGTYWSKWKQTGDNIWRGRWYACTYGGR